MLCRQRQKQNNFLTSWFSWLYSMCLFVVFQTQMAKAKTLMVVSFTMKCQLYKWVVYYLFVVLCVVLQVFDTRKQRYVNYRMEYYVIFWKQIRYCSVASIQKRLSTLRLISCSSLGVVRGLRWHIALTLIFTSLKVTEIILIAVPCSFSDKDSSYKYGSYDGEFIQRNTFCKVFK